MKALLRVPVVLAIIVLLGSSSEPKEFKRVDKFPVGEQSSVMGSFLTGLKDVNTVEVTVDSPYEKVWAAMNQVAKQFAKVGGPQSVVWISSRVEFRMEESTRMR